MFFFYRPLSVALVALVATAGLLTGCMEPVDASHPEVRKLNDSDRELRNQLTSLEDQMEILTMEVAGLADRLEAIQQNGVPAAGGGASARDYENQINALNKGLLDLKNELAAIKGDVDQTKTVAQQAAEAAASRTTASTTARTEAAAPAGAGTGGATSPAGAAITPAPARTSVTPPPARTTATPAPARTQERPQPQGSYYVFKDGDTVESVARANGLTAERLRQVNNIPAGRNPISGARIWVPAQ